MASAKIVTWSRPDKNGEYPIGIKIWNNGKPSYIFEGHTLPRRNLWDAKKQEVKKAFPNAARLTNLLTKKLSEIRNKVLEIETVKPKVAAKVIKQEYKSLTEEKKVVTFREIANQYLEEQKACGNYDIFNSDTTRLKRFYEFTKNEKITFEDITVDLLQRYTIFLKVSKKYQYDKNKPPRPLSERTITNHLMVIRTIYNRAINAKLVSKDYYPFGGKGNISIKLTGAAKIGLDESEIKKLEEIDLSEYSAICNDARNVWLTEFYFAGMRVTDCLLLKWPDFQNGRLYYQMSKNGEHGSVKVPAKALAIIEQYRYNCGDKVNNKHDLVFPFLQNLPSLDERYELRRRIAYVNGTLNKVMKQLMVKISCTKNASQHKARHAFAQRAEEKEIHPKVLQKMYRHESILTTMKYQSNFSFKKADEAIDAVLDF